MKLKSFFEMAQMTSSERQEFNRSYWAGQGQLDRLYLDKSFYHETKAEIAPKIQPWLRSDKPKLIP